MIKSYLVKCRYFFDIHMTHNSLERLDNNYTITITRFAIYPDTYEPSTVALMAFICGRLTARRSGLSRVLYLPHFTKPMTLPITLYLHTIIFMSCLTLLCLFVENIYDDVSHYVFSIVFSTR